LTGDGYAKGFDVGNSLECSVKLTEVRPMCHGYHMRWRLFQMFCSGLIWSCCRITRMPIDWCYRVQVDRAMCLLKQWHRGRCMGRIKLSIHEITFRLSQCTGMWSQSTNVTNGRTDDYRAQRRISR